MTFFDMGTDVFSILYKVSGTEPLTTFVIYLQYIKLNEVTELSVQTQCQTSPGAWH